MWLHGMEHERVGSGRPTAHVRQSRDLGGQVLVHCQKDVWSSLLGAAVPVTCTWTNTPLDFPSSTNPSGRCTRMVRNGGDKNRVLAQCVSPFERPPTLCRNTSSSPCFDVHGVWVWTYFFGDLNPPRNAENKFFRILKTVSRPSRSNSRYPKSVTNAGPQKQRQ